MIMTIEAATAENNIVTSRIEENFDSYVLKNMEEYELGCYDERFEASEHPEAELLKALKSEGSYEDGDWILTYEKKNCLFGTQAIHFEYLPEDVIDRFCMLIIEMPGQQ